MVWYDTNLLTSMKTRSAGNRKVGAWSAAGAQKSSKKRIHRRRRQKKKNAASKKDRGEEESASPPPQGSGIFPLVIFEKILRLSPDRRAHNAFEHASKEMRGLVRTLDDGVFRWPDGVRLNPEAWSRKEGVITFDKSRNTITTQSDANQSSFATFTADSKNFIVSEMSAAGARTVRTWDARKGLLNSPTFDELSGMQLSSTNGEMYAYERFDDYMYGLDGYLREHQYLAVLRLNITQSGARWLQDRRWLGRIGFQYAGDPWRNAPEVRYEYGNSDLVYHSQDRKVFVVVSSTSIYFRYDPFIDWSHRYRKCFDADVNDHGQSYAFLLCGSKFMIWQDSEDDIMIYTIHGPEMDGSAWTLGRFGHVDSFSHHPLEPSLVAAVGTRVLPLDGTASSTARVSHQIDLLKFSSEGEDNDFDTMHTVASKMFDTCPYRYGADAEDLTLKHKTRTVWFSDGSHMIYFYGRSIELFGIKFVVGQPSAEFVDSDPTSLQAQLVAKANTLIQEKIPDETYNIEWVKIAPNQRTLAIRMIQFVCIEEQDIKHEETWMVSV